MTSPAAPTRHPPRALVVLGIAILVAAIGIGLILIAKPSVSTDNAYLKTDMTIVSPRIRGQITSVLVKDNQAVTAGQPLVELDNSDYAQRLLAAQANLAAADAALARLASEYDLARASTSEVQTRIQAADADRARTAADKSRYQALLASGTVARQKLDEAQASAIRAAAESDRARAALAVSRKQTDVVGRRRAELLAQKAQAQAALMLAKQDADHTVITAPIAGVVADRKAEVGTYVQPGTRLLTLVPLKSLYVIANVKETQTSRMLVGQTVEIKIDALPSRKFTGRVESLSPGSGSEFGLLPFEPGTGNFTKIVQRVPVRIQLDPGQADLARLRSGLSAKVKVKLD